MASINFVCDYTITLNFSSIFFFMINFVNTFRSWFLNLWLLRNRFFQSQIKPKKGMHRAGQRCFELLALIGNPQLSFSKVFPAEQRSWPNWQTLWACTEADG